MDILKRLPKELQKIIIFNALSPTPTAKLINELNITIYLIKKLNLIIEVKPCIIIFDTYFVNKNSHNDEHMHILDMILEKYTTYENIIHIDPIIGIDPNIDPHHNFHIPEFIGLYVYHKNYYNMHMDLWQFKTAYTCYDRELISWNKI